jgi:hypothetical protein
LLLVVEPVLVVKQEKDLLLVVVLEDYFKDHLQLILK